MQQQGGDVIIALKSISYYVVEEPATVHKSDGR